jgi:hypothetical protein
VKERRRETFGWRNGREGLEDTPEVGGCTSRLFVCKAGELIGAGEARSEWDMDGVESESASSWNGVRNLTTREILLHSPTVVLESLKGRPWAG